MTRRTLAEAFDPRANSLNLLRLLFAALVLVSHSFPIGGFAGEPMLGGGSLGAFSVDAFFVISGFLITRSWLTSASAGRYLWRRFLRIFPGYWVCIVVTSLVLVPAILTGEGHHVSAPYTNGSVGHWAVANSVVYIDPSIRGVLRTAPLAGVINGSLWTLGWEFACYLGIAALGLLGILRQRRTMVLLTAAFLAVDAALWAGHGGPLSGFYPATAARFGLLFLSGALVYLFADRLSASSGWAAAAALALGGSLTLGDYRVIGALPLAYLCIWLGATLPFHSVGRTTDLSYGIYIYAFPLQQLLAVDGLAGTNPVVFMVVSILLASTVAWASWHLVERRAMALKDWSPRASPAVEQAAL